jgi:hypothetical protein
MVVSCEQVWREVSNYVDGDVDTALRSAMNEHFVSCKRCASLLAGVRNVVQLYGDERMLEVPAGFSRRLQKRIAENFPLRVKRWSTWSTWMVPVAAVVLIAGGLKLTNTFTFRRPVKSLLAAPVQDVPPTLKVVVSDGSKLFHVPGCRFIHDKESERTLTAKEAVQQGYSPCPRCLRQYLKTALAHRTGAQVAQAASSEESEQHEEDEKAEFMSAAGH